MSREARPGTAWAWIQTNWGDLLHGRTALIVFGCMLCQMGLGFGYVLGPLAGEIQTDLGWSRSEYSGARAPQTLIMALCSPLVGWSVIRFGARRLLVIAVLILAATFFGLSRIQSLWHLYAVIIVLGVALTGVGDITVGQVVTQWIERGRGLALGLVYTGSNLAGALLVPAAVAIADRSDWRTSVAWMAAGAVLVLLPAAAFLVRERAGAERPMTEREAEAARPEDPRSLDLRAALRTRSFWILAFCLFTFFFYFLALLEHLVLFLTDGGLPRAEAAGYFSTALFLGIFSKVVLGAVADRIPRRSAILVDYALLTASSFVLLLLPAGSLIWLFVGCFGFATAARDVVYPLIISDCFGDGAMAEIYGALLVALLPGGMLGPLFAAAIHDWQGSYDFAFASFAILNVLAAGLLFLLRDERRVSTLPAALEA